MNRKIYLTSLLAIILMSLSLVLNFFVKDYNIILGIIYSFAPIPNMTFFREPVIIYIDKAAYISLNVLDLLFICSFIIGLILYIISKGRYFRILKMLFALILISSSFSTLIVASSVIFPKISETSNVFYLIHAILRNVVWISISIIILYNFPRGTLLLNKHTNELVKSSIGERFIHYMVDFLFSIIFCFYFTELLLVNLFDLILPHFYINPSYLLSGTLAWMVYLTFFEALIKTTPAKILTGAKVVMIGGNDINLKAALLRSLVRLIPLEPFSFLQDRSGWHDEWSKTQVVKEFSEK